MSIELDLPSLISTVGFPIAITIWLLYERHSDKKADREQETKQGDRLNSTLNGLGKNINDLNISINLLSEKVDHLGA